MWLGEELTLWAEKNWEQEFMEGWVRTQKFAKRLLKKTKPWSEWEGRLYLEEAGRSQH